MKREPRVQPLVGDLFALYEAAMGDVLECNRHVDSEDTQFWRRVACHAVFAALEAMTSHLKQTALQFAIGQKDIFTEAERLALNEIDYSIDENGRVVEGKAKIRFLDNVCFALRSFARATDQPFTITKGRGWEALAKSVKVRDRITHPKSAKHFEIKDPEKQEIEEAWKWFGDTIRSLAEKLQQGCNDSGTERMEQRPSGTPGQRG